MKKLSSNKLVLLIGLESSGKTAVCNRLKSGYYSPTLATVGSPVYRSVPVQTTGDLIDLQDYSGNPKYEPPILKERLSPEKRTARTPVFIVCFDLSKPERLNELHVYLQPYKKKYPEAPFIIVGTKSDTLHDDTSLAQLRNFAKENQSPCFITSAKKNTRINNVFHEACTLDKTSYLRSLLKLNNLIEKLNDINVEEEFIYALNSLHKQLAKKYDNQILTATLNFVKQFARLVVPIENRKKKHMGLEQLSRLFQTYENSCKHSSSYVISRLTAIAIITGICAVVGISFGAFLGVGIGLLAGAWTGPGSIAFAGVGLINGSLTGWTLGTIIAASVTGLLFSASAIKVSGSVFFKKNDAEKLADDISTFETTIKNRYAFKPQAPDSTTNHDAQKPFSVKR